MTAEHVVGNWFRRFAVDRYPEFGESVDAWHEDQSQDRRNDRRIDYRAVPVSQTARIACAPCNNGWMSRLENRAAELLLPLLKGAVQTLNPHDLADLSTWALKTTVVIQASKPGGAHDTPEAHRTYLRAKVAPPESTAVWISSWGGARWVWHAYWRMRGTVPGERAAESANLYGCTFTLGPLVFQTFGSTQPALRAEGIQFENLTRIWPAPTTITCAAHPPAMQASDLESFAAKIPIAIEAHFDQPWLQGRVARE